MTTTPERSPSDAGVSRAALTALARNVAAARTRRSWSQTELANRAGVTQQRVSLVETGRDDVRLDTVSRIARALRMKVGTLLKE